MPELTDAQLLAAIERCEYCERKPCRDACPAHCSPADFIMAGAVGQPADIQRAAALIYIHNPLGGVCGAVCPEFHCMAACSRLGFDEPVEIPAIQETLIRRAHRLGVVPRMEAAEENGKRVAVLGAGPAGLAAAFTLAQLGYRVEVFEREEISGGACRLIPPHRLDGEVLEQDLEFLLGSDRIELHLGAAVDHPDHLAGFDATVVAVGLTEPIQLGIPGEGAAFYGWDYLSDPDRFELEGTVAVIGGGAVACDVAVAARARGAERVEMFALEKLSEMPLAERERQDIVAHGIHVNGRTKLTSIDVADGKIRGIQTLKVHFPAAAEQAKTGEPVPFDLRGVHDHAGTEQGRDDVGTVIVAIGHRSSVAPDAADFIAGDCETGPSTVVEAAAAGKNAAMAVHADLSGATVEPPPRPRKSLHRIPGYDRRPVSLDTDFFGRTIPSPLLLSAAPPTDGYEQMNRAFEAGWAGGIMKTAFDAVDIHIPSEYMFTLDPMTWGNCDNVSGHALDRVCGEVEKLVAAWPDRLVMASTGGPVSGDDAADTAVWQSNTRKLEAAGIGGIEYSLSCPQGGDGTEGDIVSQNAALTTKIIEWILKAGDPSVPKLFKLTAAVTSVEAIVIAIRKLLDRYPDAKAGVTLANTFPSLAFRPGRKPGWEEAIVVGMSGGGVTPISNLTLAKVSNLGVVVSGNGGPMDYKAAADFLALGARTVQFCTVAMKYGVDVVDELHDGLSHLMAARGMASVEDLIGAALPDPITDFMDLTPVKKLSSCDTTLCVSCGNCSRCSYLAIELDDELHPVVDPARCVGCSICTRKCISGALSMKDRTAEELAVLRED
jgi:NADPH-dependent glutamate synthase beta subunit-like oxidoreductase/dihydroorotate dehydrogenase/ferredoxin